MCRLCLSRRAFMGRGLGAVAGLTIGVRGEGGVGGFSGLSGAAGRPYRDGRSVGMATPLELATESWRWIQASAVVTDGGLTWPADPLVPTSVGATLYSHGTGVLPFALELFHATGDEEVLDAARAGADHLAVDLEGVEGSGLYVGLGGVAWILEETYRATGDRRYRDHAARATDLILERAVPLGEGIAWPTGSGDGRIESNDIVSGTAGTILTLLWLGERMGHPDALETAARAGRRLLENSIAEPAGLRWDIYDGYAREMPNFSHGTAGMAYALASLSEVRSESEFLDAALAGAAYLTSIATVVDDTYLIRHNSPEGMDLYYLSWCHGPVGTNRLFHRLEERTGDRTWGTWVERGARGIMDTGVPEQRTPGFWENVSQCGGSAGLGDYYLTLHRMTGREEYRTFADRMTNDLLLRSTVGGRGRKWTQSEHRVQPDLLVAQTGFMQGAAGIGKYYLHLHEMETRGGAPVITLPDAPY